MEKQVLDAIVIQKDGIVDVRCRNCGKLLFRMVYENFHVDISKHRVIIVSRCTRSSCKMDNKIVINLNDT